MSCPKFGENWTGISETSRPWDSRVEGYCNHIAIAGSVKGVSGKDAACDWVVEQVDYDKEQEPWYAILWHSVGEIRGAENVKKIRAVGLHFGAFQA